MVDLGNDKEYVEFGLGSGRTARLFRGVEKGVPFISAGVFLGSSFDRIIGFDCLLEGEEVSYAVGMGADGRVRREDLIFTKAYGLSSREEISLDFRNDLNRVFSVLWKNLERGYPSF